MRALLTSGVRHGAFRPQNLSQRVKSNTCEWRSTRSLYIVSYSINITTRPCNSCLYLSKNRGGWSWVGAIYVNAYTLGTLSRWYQRRRGRRLDIHCFYDTWPVDCYKIINKIDSLWLLSNFKFKLYDTRHQVSSVMISFIIRRQIIKRLCWVDLWIMSK